MNPKQPFSLERYRRMRKRNSDFNLALSRTNIANVNSKLIQLISESDPPMIF